MTQRDAARITQTTTLGFFMLGVLFLAALPLFTPGDIPMEYVRVEWVEWLLVTGSFLTLLGLIIHTVAPFKWGSQYAYVGVAAMASAAWVALQTLVPFFDIHFYVNLTVSMWLFAGIGGGGFAYFFTGGSDPVVDYLPDE